MTNPLPNMESGRTGDPAVLIDATYADQLENLAFAHLDRNPSVARRLLDELDRAEILPRSALPDGTITIGSEVTFRDNATGQMQTLVLVLPGDADIARHRISVLTPVGVALIGISEGETIWWQTQAPEIRELTVHRVKTS